MNLLDELEELGDKLKDDLELRFKKATETFTQRVIEHPQPIFTLLRTVKPVLVTHGFAVVTRYHDVVEVLRADHAFTVEPYRTSMERLAGTFTLGTDDGRRYERDISIQRLAAPRSDIPALSGFVERAAEELVAQAGERIDVADVSRRLPARFMGHWFGTPGPDEDTMIEWAMKLFADIFTNVQNDPAVSAAADEAAAGMKPYLESEIVARKGQVSRQDVLGRLIAMQVEPATAFSDEEIRNNLFGLIVGFIPTVCTATTFAVDALLDRPEALAGAQAAARADDVDGVRAHMWEAMRLAPQGPGLLRRAGMDYRVAEGTHHETLIPKGTLTFAATQSAMLDGDVVDDPDEFRLDRPPHHYLHFGTGMHQCFGRYANALQIPMLAKALLRGGDLRRAEGDAGQIVKEGPYPRSLVVTAG